MIRPPMPHTITASSVPVLDAEGNPIYDRFGRQQFSDITSVARTQEKTSIRQNAQGENVAVTVEIDVPPDTIIPVGTEVTFTMTNNRSGSGTVVDTDESLTFSGKRAVFRTLFVNG